jgi:3'(2'), 5'-bisphosphate nucleotidase
MPLLADMLPALAAIARQAGAEILDVYHSPDFAHQAEIKGDNSPLTVADRRSHEVIIRGLIELDSTIPIISEEAELPDYATRSQWNRYWLVDPLDGTKEFLKRNDEFTVNIALVQEGIPVLGVVYVPVTELLFIGVTEADGSRQATRSEGTQAPLPIQSARTEKAPRVALRSRSHATPEEDSLLAAYKVENWRSAGSSLKITQVAEGEADLYYRHGPTMEWDTAAAHAVVLAAGGRILSGKSELQYNKAELRNGSFLVAGANLPLEIFFAWQDQQG